MAAGLKIQERDINLLRGLLDARFLTLPQIAELYFSGKEPMARKRLGKLKDNAVVGVKKRKLVEKSLYHLTRQGLSILNSHQEVPDLGEVSWEEMANRLSIGQSTIEHEIEVQDVRVSLTTALEGRADVSLDEFITWPKQIEFRAERPVEKLGGSVISRKVVNKPDGYLELTTPAHKMRMFLEVDRSTEEQRRLVWKMIGYRSYFNDGGHAVRSGFQRHEKSEAPFVVLMTTKNVERRNNLCHRLLKVSPLPIRTLVWVATLEDVLADPLGSIWVTPKAYEAAVSGSVFDVARIAESFYKGRHLDRDRLVDERVERRPLIR